MLLNFLKKYKLNKLFLLLLILNVSQKTEAQEAEKQLLTPYSPYIDTALQAVNMTYYDLAMPWDAIKPDSFRLDIIKKLFNKPLETIEETNRQAERLINLHKLAPGFLLSYYLSKKHFKGFFEKLDKNGQSLTKKEYIKNKNFKFLNSYIKDCKIIDEELKEVLNKLNPEERKLLSTKYLKLWQEDAEIEKITSLTEYKKREHEGIAISKKLFAIAQNVDFNRILEIGDLSYSISLRISEEATKANLPDKEKTFKTPYGKVYYGDNPPEDALIVILTKNSSRIKCHPVKNRIQIMIDLGGDDIYEGEDFAQGSALFGVSVLIDKGGNDIYRAKNYSQGTGFFGCGILYDQQGSDNYISETISQGAASFGVGLLIDNEGNDSYKGSQYVQGIGFTKGYGAVLDLAGNDNYVAAGQFVDVLRYEDHFTTMSQGMGMGFRPVASGGIGMLVDAKGNDNYFSDIYGQGSGYWFALGGLVDFEGNDNYISYQYAQGSGIHLAFGALIDHTGKDFYRSNGVSQGCGHDLAFGGLLDKEGDDNYVCEGLSQGAGNANAVSFFMDGGGNDGYISPQPNTQGYHDWRRGYGMLGMFFDIGGKDWYGSFWGKDGTYWTQSTYGIGMDINPPKIKNGTANNGLVNNKNSDSLKIVKNIAHDLQGLFDQASAAPLSFQYLVEAARDSIVNRGEIALHFLMTKLATEAVREVHMLRLTVPRFKEAGAKFLKDSLFAKDERVVARSLDILAEMAAKGYGKEAVPALEQMTKCANWRYRSAAFEAIGNFHDTTFARKIIPGLKDNHPAVRRGASNALMKCGPDKYFQFAYPLLEDSSQQVRNNVVKYFARFGSKAADSLLSEVIFNDKKKYSDQAKLHALDALSQIKELQQDQAEKLLVLLKKDWRYQNKLLKICQNTKFQLFRQKLVTELSSSNHPLIKRKVKEL